MQGATGLKGKDASKAKLLIPVLVLLPFAAFLRYEVSSAVFFALVIALLELGAVYLVYYFSRLPARVAVGNRSVSKATLFLCAVVLSLLLGIVLEALTLIGAPQSSPVSLDNWSKRRLVCFVTLSFIALVACMRRMTGTPSSASATTLSLSSLKPEWGSCWIIAGGTCALMLVLALVAGVGIGAVANPASRTVFLVLCCGTGVLLCLLLHRKFSQRFDLIFLVISLSLTSYLAFTLPPLTGISPDDQIHYDRSLGLSYLGSSEYSDAEIKAFEVPWVVDSHVQFDEVEGRIQELNRTYDTTAEHGLMQKRVSFVSTVHGEVLSSVWIVGYIPSAIGLWVARLFDLSFTGQIVFGRWANAIAYSCVIAVAIRALPRKKKLMALIALLPTSLYLAANYSYDAWVISFLMLGIACLAREISKRQETLRLSGFARCAFLIFLGLCPKAVYFPLVGLFFLMPASKFSSKKAHRIFLASVVAFGLIMVATFVVPLLFSSAAQQGDVRGGSDVSASGQIGFILHDPIGYIGILGSFLAGYLSPIMSNSYTVSYTYMGNLVEILPSTSALAYILLIIAALVDSEGEPWHLTSGAKVWTLFVSVVSIALAVTALYVSFTPVGSATIAGVQGRYILPLMFPALMIVDVKGAGPQYLRTNVCLVGCMALFSILCIVTLLLVW